MEVSAMTQSWFWAGFIGMAVGSAIILLLGMMHAKKLHVVLALAVTLIATLSYFALASGQASFVVDGNVVYFGRYIDWLLTTPLLLLSLIIIGLPKVKDPSENRGRIGLIATIIGADILMIATGFIANISTTTTQIAFWYVASCLFFFVIIALMFGRVRREAIAANKENAKKYTVLLLFLSAVWLWYPVLWILGSTGFQAVNFEAEVALYAVLDVTAKAIFGIVALLMIAKKK
jgi:bacteriorhodopsin